MAHHTTPCFSLSAYLPELAGEAHPMVLPPFCFTCCVEVKVRTRILCLFGHSAVGSNMFCIQGNAGARCSGAKLADFLQFIHICIVHMYSLQALKTFIFKTKQFSFVELLPAGIRNQHYSAVFLAVCGCGILCIQD